MGEPNLKLIIYDEATWIRFILRSILWYITIRNDMVQRLIFVQGFLTFCQVRFRGQRHTCYCFFQFSCKRMVKSGSFFSLKPSAHQGESKFQLLRISCFGEGNKQTNLLTWYCFRGRIVSLCIIISFKTFTILYQQYLFPALQD